MTALRVLIAVGLAFFVAGGILADESTTLGPVREHLQKGRYEQADEAIRSLLLSEPAAADREDVVAVQTSLLVQQGRLEPALSLLKAAVERSPKNASLRARLAEIQFHAGQHTEAGHSVEAALELEPQEPRARLVRASLKLETGQVAEAIEEFRWFVTFYNRTQPEDPETLLLVGEGSLQYARLKSVSSIFDFVLNTLCADILKADPLRWEACVLSGRLLLEKYNRSQAKAEFDAALAINPQSAPALAGLAELALQETNLEEAERRAQAALKIDPSLPEAIAVRCDIAFLGDQPEQARPLLEAGLRRNPADQGLLARRSACDLLKGEGTLPPIAEWTRLLAAAPEAAAEPSSKATAFETTWRELLQRNPRPGPYLSRLGEILEAERQFGHAEACYDAAVRVMPEFAASRCQLAMLYLRTGRTIEAGTLLDAAFKADPYHVRVSNLRKVVSVLKEYDTVSTDHFVIRVDRSQRVLGELAAEQLEAAYPELVRQYGYEPPLRTQFEIYAKAKGQSAHAWFSARMTGLPWIQTIGASTGRVVALASPLDSPEPFNWAVVLKHELVHVITLQATEFRIPHWLTEALAVKSEGMLVRDDWLPILAERYPDRLYRLDTINGGFQKPRQRQDWDLAYSQSRLYLAFLEKTYGEEVVPRMLAAYRQGKSTGEVLRETLQTSPTRFESEFVRFVKETIDTEGASRETPRPILAEAKAALEKSPEEAAARGAYAYALFVNKEAAEGLRRAELVLQTTPAEPWSALVVAIAKLREKHPAEALEVLQPASDVEPPNSHVLLLYGSLLHSEEKTETATQVLERARKTFPKNRAMQQELADLYREADRLAEAKMLWEELAASDYDDVEPRRTLAETAWSEGDAEAAARWAREALLIDVGHAGLHTLLARAESRRGRHRESARAWKSVLWLDPRHTEAPLECAKELVAAGETGEAREVLKSLLNDQPRHKGAGELLRQLDEGAAGDASRR